MSTWPFPKNIIEIVVNKEFEMNGYPQDYQEVKHTNFFTERTTTKEIEKEYHKWLVNYLSEFVSEDEAHRYAFWQILWQWLRTV